MFIYTDLIDNYPVFYISSHIYKAVNLKSNMLHMQLGTALKLRRPKSRLIKLLEMLFLESIFLSFSKNTKCIIN